MKVWLVLVAFFIAAIINIVRHEQKYYVGACVRFGDQILRIEEETKTSYILANKYIRIMDKKEIVRRYYGVVACPK